MTGFYWWIANCLSRTLDSEEREAAFGDLMECGAAPAQALRDLAGLVARRQAKVLVDARLWRLFVFVIVPLSLMLSLMSQLVCEPTSVAAWFYISNWTPGYLANGFQKDLVSEFGSLVVSWISLACWAWTSGMFLGRYLRRAVWLGGAFFVLLISLLNFAVIIQWPAESSAGAFSLLVYRRCLLVAIAALLVVTPALVGLQNGIRLSFWPILQRRILSVCIFAAMIALLIECVQPHLLRNFFYPAFAVLSPVARKVIDRFWRPSYEVT